LKVGETLATRLRDAFNARDLDAFRTLLAEGASWGDDPESESFCRDRDAIIVRFRQLLADGVHATIAGTTTGPRGIVVELHVEWPVPGDRRPARQTVYQAYLVTDDRVTEIHGHADPVSAVAAISH
jgi:SnoaL-like domain